MNLTKRHIQSFYNLFYPKLCSACATVLQQGEKGLCTACLGAMPFTNYENSPENFAEKLFWGKVNIEMACSLFFYEKGSVYGNVIHRLKYKGDKEGGRTLAQVLANKLLSSRFNKIDAILPVPLHKKRQKERGYNQSEVIAEVLSEITGKELIVNGVSRIKNTNTQTQKGRFNRYENLASVFKVNNPEILQNKHILLVDDIVTTGATLETLAAEILKVNETKVSVATLGIAFNV